MKRFSWLLLVIVVAFLGASSFEECADEAPGRCPPVCHLSCLDGCATVPVEPDAPALAFLENARARRPEFEMTPIQLDFPPDYSPPRA